MLLTFAALRKMLSPHDAVLMEGDTSTLEPPPTTIPELRDRMSELHALGLSIQNRADGERRELTEEEIEELASVTGEFDRLEEDLHRRERIAAQAEKLARPIGRKSEADPPMAPQNRVDDDDPPPASRTRESARARDDRYQGGRWGWKNFGEFAMGVKTAHTRGGTVDNRLAVRMQPGVYGNEGTGADGGFAVPPDFRQAIMEKIMGEASLLSRTDQLVTSGNAITFPKDETAPWQTTGGIQAYWESEAGQKTPSKLSLEQTTLRLNKLAALVPVSDELIEDAPALDAYLRRKAPVIMDFKINLAIVQGNGVGMPLGILNSPSLVSVAKETNQLADTIVGANIIKMWSRLHAESRQNAVWLINQDIEPFLLRLSLPGLDNTGAAVTGWGTHVYLPPNGLSQSPYGTLMGRPVLPTQAAETLGDKGDIILVDLSKYMTVTKGGGLRTDVSIHLWFDYDITAFRFVFRLGGAPWWNTVITPRDGSNTTSWAVTLDERAG